MRYEAQVDLDTTCRKRVSVSGEGDVAYDSLVVATGFDYADPGVPGGDLDGLYYVKNIRRAMEWDKVLDTVKRAVVIEASPLAMEMVNALAHRGIETHLVDSNPWAMASGADPDIVAPVEESWREMGVHLHFNTDLKGFTGEGTSRPSRPRKARSRRPGRGGHPQGAEQRPGHCGRTGHRLDRRRRRRRDAADLGRQVWAAGDCIEVPHGVSKVPLQGLTGSHAYAQGKVAGSNAGGGSASTSRSTCRGAWSPASG